MGAGELDGVLVEEVAWLKSLPFHRPWTTSMPTIAELIARQITPEEKGAHDPRIDTLTGPITPRSAKPHDRYEADVFNCLWANRKQLGIAFVRKFTARLVDGCVELTDATRLAVEVKYRMNWKKALEAENEFRRFLKHCPNEAKGVSGGLVFFEEFSGDWTRKAVCRNFENGWSHWYRDHSVIEDRRLDLLRLVRKPSPTNDDADWCLEGFPAGKTIAPNAG